MLLLFTGFASNTFMASQILPPSELLCFPSEPLLNDVVVVVCLIFATHRFPNITLKIALLVIIQIRNKSLFNIVSNQTFLGLT
jgi:hypothetical protein